MTANLAPNKHSATLRAKACVAATVLAMLAVLAIVMRPEGAQAQEPSAAQEGTLAQSVTHHRYAIGGGEADFTATAGVLPLGDAKGGRGAGIFYVAYTRDGAQRENRPLTFAFNGGPGNSSAYLHLGALGPRVVDFGADAEAPALPARLIDNPDHWLDLTDLVLVDPVGTGFSRAAAGGDDASRRYLGVREDLQALASFITLYLARNNREVSPVYLVGESYGGFRAARLPQLLAAEHGVSVAGVFLISPALEFSLLSDDGLALLPDVLRLPSYAAVTLEHSTAPTPAALAEAERFALGPFLSALAASPRNEAALSATYATVAHYTGLPELVVAQHEGRIPVNLFRKETRRPDRLLISRYDGSVAAPDPYPESSRVEGDPIYDGLKTLLTGIMAEYLTGPLAIHTDLAYRLFNGEVSRQWNWRSGLSSREGFAGASDELREALAGNRNFKVVVAHGMTDLVTPYMTSRYVLDHLPLALTGGRVTFNLYPGGHMMYLRSASRARLHADAAKLYPSPPL